MLKCVFSSTGGERDHILEFSLDAILVAKITLVYMSVYSGVLETFIPFEKDVYEKYLLSLGIEALRFVSKLILRLSMILNVTPLSRPKIFIICYWNINEDIKHNNYDIDSGNEWS